MRQPSSPKNRLRLWRRSLFSVIFLLLIIVSASAIAHAQDAAPLGTPYRWSQNSDPTSNANRSSAPGLNVIGNTTDIALDPNGGDSPSAYEAGGIIWSNNQELHSVSLINGSWDSSTTDGVFCANLALQTTIDGSTWITSNWTVSPSYSYDSSGASLQTYTFTGAPITVRGVRISGQVHCSDSGSWLENMREIIANGPSPQTIWTPSTTPATLDVSDYTGAVNLGVRFQSNVSGTISGIRFYKTALNLGTHTATLYDNAGTVLAQTTFSNETGSGWQEVDFPPVNITAYTTYVAAYHTTNGHYSVNSGYFNSSFSNGQQLTALASGAGGGSNGVFLYGDSAAFPTNTYNANNYWIDVVFNVHGGIPPWPASNLQGQALSSERVKLSWTASPGDPTGVGYSIYRNGVFAGTTNGTSYIDIGLSSNTEYAYDVVAFNGYGGAAQTPSIAVTTPNNYMPASLQNFFPVGPDGQPTTTMQAWHDRGANTLIRTPQDNFTPADFPAWDAAASSFHLKYIRDPDPIVANDLVLTDLLAWHQRDEPEYRNPVPLSTILDRYQTWHQNDPTMPISINFSGASLIGYDAGWCDLTCYVQYLGGGDWAMSDVYPVAGWGQPNSLWWVGQSVDTLYRLAPNKPIMQFVEVSNQGIDQCNATNSCLTPTIDQFRAEFWDAIIHGARGVFVFPERVTSGNFSFDNTTPDMDVEITKQFNTATSLASVLQGVINPIGMSASVASPLEVAWRNYNGHQYIFALNFSSTAKAGRAITLTGIGSATQAVVYGESRDVPISNGVMTDDFGPYAIHIYQVN